MQRPVFRLKPEATMGMPAALLLDLDGTLIDSAPDIAVALNATLTELGREPLSQARVRAMIGHGIAALVRAALDASDGLPPAPALDHAVAQMTRRYCMAPVRNTTLLPGVRTLLSTCRRLGIAVACVTNKPVGVACAILKHFEVLEHFAIVIGGDGDTARKPAPDGLLAATIYLGVPVGEAWMVGDGLTDAFAAHAAGTRMIGVRSDYGEEPLTPADVDVEVTCLDELTEILLGLVPSR